MNLSYQKADILFFFTVYKKKKKNYEFRVGLDESVGRELL